MCFSICLLHLVTFTFYISWSIFKNMLPCEAIGKPGRHSPRNHNQSDFLKVGLRFILACKVSTVCIWAPRCFPFLLIGLHKVYRRTRDLEFRTKGIKMQATIFSPSVVSNYIWGSAWSSFSSSGLGHWEEQDFRELFAAMLSMTLIRHEDLFVDKEDSHCFSKMKPPQKYCFMFQRDAVKDSLITEPWSKLSLPSYPFRETEHYRKMQMKKAWFKFNANEKISFSFQQRAAVPISSWQSISKSRPIASRWTLFTG